MNNFMQPTFYILSKGASEEEFNYVEVRGFYEALMKNWQLFQFAKHVTLENEIFPIFYSKN